MNKNSQEEYYNIVLTTVSTEYIIKVVGAKPFEKRSASKEITKYKNRSTLARWRFYIFVFLSMKSITLYII